MVRVAPFFDPRCTYINSSQNDLNFKGQMASYCTILHQFKQKFTTDSSDLPVVLPSPSWLGTPIFHRAYAPKSD